MVVAAFAVLKILIDSNGPLPAIAGQQKGLQEMKRVAAVFALAFFVFSTPVHAQSTAKKNSIEQLVETVADAYSSSTLGSLDSQRPYLGRVKIIIEHSLAGDTDKDRFEVKDFRTLAQGEQWLKGREREDGTPFRNLQPLVKCRKGLCTYDFNNGILHNQLYLKKVAYGYRNGRPFIKTIYLLDGD